MENYKISISNIEDHIEKIGIDVRPVIELKMEKDHLYNFYTRLIEVYPNLFESLVQSPNDFQIKKKFIFPGKGELETATLAITQRGLVLIIPRKVVIFDEQTNIDETEKMVVEFLKIFRQSFPHKKICRVGQVNEYVFTLGQQRGVQFLAERFTKIKMPPDGELKIRVNRPVDDYNRIIEMQPVQKIEQSLKTPGEQHLIAYGLKVIVDFNNRNMTEDLNIDSIRGIIQSSIEFNNKELYEFLNVV